METSHDSRNEAALAALDGVSSTLLIPLLARAIGDAWFPIAAIDDRSAAGVVSALGGDHGGSWWVDEATVYGVLVRTRVFRELARSFMARRPRSQGINLACGLADYFQWLDNGRNRWVDVDLQSVVSLRRGLMPLSSRRQRLVSADLTQPDWWSRLRIRSDAPVLVMCEGLLMYLEPPEVTALLSEIATRAPAGTEILADAICSLAVGRPWWCPAVDRTGVQFRWGPCQTREFAAMHPRLRLLRARDLAQECGLPYAIPANAFRMFAGVPFYGIYHLVVSDSQGDAALLPRPSRVHAA